MKKRWSFPTIVLAVIVIFVLAMIAAGLILSALHLMFRQWVITAAVVFVIAALVVILFYYVLRIKPTWLKAAVLVLAAAAVVFAAPRVGALLSFGRAPEYRLERDGKNYIAYVGAYMEKYTVVRYYDEVNFLVSGNRVVMEDYYGVGLFDPYVQTDRELIRTTWYDKDGSILKTVNYK